MCDQTVSFMAVDTGFFESVFAMASCTIVHSHAGGWSRGDVEQRAPENIKAVAADSAEHCRPKSVGILVTKVARNAIHFAELHVRCMRKVNVLRLRGIHDPGYLSILNDIVFDKSLLFPGSADRMRMTSGTF